MEGPVIRGEGPGQGALSQGNHEVHAPQEGNDVVDLQVKEGLLKQALVVVFDEDAAGSRAVWVSLGRVEVLDRTRQDRGQQGFRILKRVVWYYPDP